MACHIVSYDTDEFIKKLNSQSCEQTNAILVKVKNVLSYMTYNSYKSALIFYMENN